MTRKRGRPTVPLPVHPERVISRAVQAGLSATIELQRSIVNKTTQNHYKSSREIWNRAREVYAITKTQGDADYSYILKAEPQIRDNMLKILYEKAAEYGHNEVARQKNSDDTVGPLNQRLNACGAVVREFSEREFPHPTPVLFGFRTQQAEYASKQFRVAGYSGSSLGPKVILVHPDLPSLDFGDAVRSHNEYLATMCTIHNVSVSETIKYSNLFLLLTRPYLEHIYSEYKVGKPEFRRGVNGALRLVKKLIPEAGYKPSIHEVDTVTGRFTSPELRVSADFFAVQFDEAWKYFKHHPVLTELEKLIGGGFIRSPGNEEPCLTERDVKHLRELAQERARIRGSIMHRRISHLFSSPWNLRNLILNEHRISNVSGPIIFSEVPLETALGKGRADLILSEPVITQDGKRVLQKPSLVVEIKTHMGHEWYIESESKHSQSREYHGLPQRVVPHFMVRDRTLDDAEWERIIRSVPNKNTTNQLDIYADAISEKYLRITGERIGHVLRGTLIIEATADIREVMRVARELLIKGYQQVREKAGRIERTVVRPTGDFKEKIALIIHEQVVSGPKRESAIQVSKAPTYTPFRNHKDTERDFILYLAGSSPTSAGHSAAWNAQNYHGLHLLYEMSTVNPETEFLWIDLASQFVDSGLAEARLRLRPRGYSGEAIAQAHPDHIREFFETIKVSGFLDSILAYLYEDGPFPSFKIEKSDGTRVIVVSGADIIRDATPKTHMDQLQQVIDHLLDSLPDDQKTTVLWFDSPVPSTDKATVYGTCALLPFFDNSTLGEIVTEIIWNFPVAPQSAVEYDEWKLPTIGDVPMHDDIRVIVRQTIQELNTELALIPFLHGWSKRFKNQGRGLVVEERELLDIIPDVNTRKRMKLLSFTLLPWLAELYGDTCLSEETNVTMGVQMGEIMSEFIESDGIEYRTVNLAGAPEKPLKILDLMRFRPPSSRAGMSYVSTLGSINSQRLYRSPNSLRTTPQAIIESETSVLPQNLDQQWLYGVWFESEDENEDQPFWIVMQNPEKPTRMLVGCFTRKLPDGDGYLWAHTQQPLLKKQGADDILGLPHSLLMYRRVGSDNECYVLKPTETNFEFQGHVSVISKGYSSVSQLRAIRLEETNLARESLVEHSPNEIFYQQVAAVLKRYITSIMHPTPVSVKLELVDDSVCQVQFIDGNDNVLHQQETRYTAELISLLRWPITQMGGMFTDAGRHVTWNIFDDIQYGELDFIAPYVTFKAARSESARFPERIAQFFEETATLKVSIEHDRSICPIALGEEIDHGACWRISLPPNCSDSVRSYLNRPMTGEQLNGILAPGQIYTGQLYSIQLVLPTVSKRDESVVFHEERYIRMLLRQHGVFLRRLDSGTYLHVQNQKWIVDVFWDEKGYVIWNAVSNMTGLSFKSNSHIIPLSYSQSAEEECDMILGIITEAIPCDHIQEYDILKNRTLDKLKGMGYTTQPPTCEWRIISTSKTKCVFGLFLIDGLENPIVRYEIDLSVDQTTSVEEMMDQYSESFKDPDILNYHILNEDKFFQQLITWIKRFQLKDIIKEDDLEIN